MRSSSPFKPQQPRPWETPGQTDSQPSPVVVSPDQPESGSPVHPYDFIVNPAPPPRRGLFNGQTSAAVRVAMISGGLLVLLIAFVFIKGLISGSSNLTSFITVTQDQQELIHLATNAAQQKDLTTNNKNFAATAQLSLTSSQSQIFTYLKTNGVKVDKKTLNLKLSAKTDSQLQSAAAAAFYNQTFKEIMNTQLEGYINDLKQAYNLTKGDKGHALLDDNYNQAQLLLEQLNAPAT